MIRDAQAEFRRRRATIKAKEFRLPETWGTPEVSAFQGDLGQFIPSREEGYGEEFKQDSRWRVRRCAGTLLRL
jgi:hypothetical protein